MNFCKNCNFMLYKKLANEEKSTVCNVSKESKTCQLYEYCKNCGYEKDITDEEVSVYKRNYKNNFVIDKIIKNKYIVYDNTLPRLNIDCKNERCISNEYFSHLNKNNCLIINNIPENITDNAIFHILNKFDLIKILLILIKDFLL